jgi:hypothetical protein
MTYSSLARALVTILATTLSLNACGGSSNAPLPSAVSQSAPMAKASGPAPCPGQGPPTTLFATSGTVTLTRRSKLQCIPAFDDFGGTIAIPAVSPSVTAVFTSSTTNYNNLLPKLTKKGKPIFYLQIQTSAGNTFGKKVRGVEGLIGKKLVAGDWYTVYGQATTGSGGILHLIINLGPCSTKAASGKDGGVIAGLGKLLEGQQLTNGSSTIIYEVYTGERVTQPC